MKQHYRPEIDGLRAVAVLAVVLYHAGGLLPGGYVGVDVFFVISGYLITRLIRDRVDAGTFSIVEFWERRIRRLMPALVVMVAATLVLGHALLIPPDLRDLGASSVAQAALVANVYFWRQTGYFAEAAETKPLLHTWSLAVEEQFYLALPPALMLLALWARRRTPWALSALAAGSFAVSLYGTEHHPTATFFLLPTRAWELLAGSLLTYLPDPPARSRWGRAAQWVGMAMVIAPMFALDRRSPFPGVAAIPPVAGTAALIWGSAAGSRGALKRLLSTGPFTSVGLISYSLYLWHWPILVYLGVRWPDHGALALAAAIALSLLAGACSWRFVETPIRRGGSLSSRRSLFAAAALATGTLAAGGLALVGADGLPGRFDSSLSPLFHDTQWRGREYATPRSSPEARFVPLGAPVDATGGGRPDFFLWGDSHAMALAGAVDRVASQRGLRGFAFVKSSHLPVPDGWMPFLETVEANSSEVQRKDRESAVRFIKDRRPRRLLVAARWTCYLEGPSKVELDAKPGTVTWYAPRGSGEASRESSREVLAHGLQTLADLCRECGTELVLLRQVPECGIANPSREAVQFALERTATLPESPFRFLDFLQRRASFDGLLEGLDDPDVEIVDLAPLLRSPDGGLLVFQDGMSNYRDDDHLSWSGLRLLDPSLANALDPEPPAGR